VPPSPINDDLRDAAQTLTRIDVDVYREAGRDPLDPIVGYGPEDARLALFGRDPGRHEVVHGRPFVGAGGQVLRRELYAALHGTDLPDFEASLSVDDELFWANTVPYKPVGNKAWGMADKRRFAPLIADVLVHRWRGTDLIPLGRVALDWFGLTDATQRDRLRDYWQRDDRFSASITVQVVARDGTQKRLRLHPLPHPSPLNATWHRQVPALLRQRLTQLAWGPEQTRLST